MQLWMVFGTGCAGAVFLASSRPVIKWCIDFECADSSDWYFSDCENEASDAEPVEVSREAECVLVPENECCFVVDLLTGSK